MKLFRGPRFGASGSAFPSGQTLAQTLLIGNTTGGTPIDGAILFNGVLTPPAIGANQNNYNPANLSTASVLRLSSTAVFSVTGLQGGATGRVLNVRNVGGFTIRLEPEDAGSVAANRFVMGVVLPPNGQCQLMYDGTVARWFIVARPIFNNFQWGAQTSGGSIANRWLYTWYGGAPAQNIVGVSRTLVNPPGIWTNMLSSYTASALPVANTVHTFQVNGVDTALSTSIPATTLTSALVKGVIVTAAGDNVSVRTATSAVDATNSEPRCVLQFYPTQ